MLQGLPRAIPKILQQIPRQHLPKTDDDDNDNDDDDDSEDEE